MLTSSQTSVNSAIVNGEHHFSKLSVSFPVSPSRQWSIAIPSGGRQACRRVSYWSEASRKRIVSLLSASTSRNTYTGARHAWTHTCERACDRAIVRACVRRYKRACVHACAFSLSLCLLSLSLHQSCMHACMHANIFAVAFSRSRPSLSPLSYTLSRPALSSLSPSTCLPQYTVQKPAGERGDERAVAGQTSRAVCSQIHPVPMVVLCCGCFCQYIRVRTQA